MHRTSQPAQPAQPAPWNPTHWPGSLAQAPRPQKCKERAERRKPDQARRTRRIKQGHLIHTSSSNVADPNRALIVCGTQTPRELLSVAPSPPILHCTAESSHNKLHIWSSNYPREVATLRCHGYKQTNNPYKIDAFPHLAPSLYPLLYTHTHGRWNTHTHRQTQTLYTRPYPGGSRQELGSGGCWIIQKWKCMIDVGHLISTPLKCLFLLRHPTGQVEFKELVWACLPSRPPQYKSGLLPWRLLQWWWLGFHTCVCFLHSN